MEAKPGAQALGIVTAFDREFARLHVRWADLIHKTPPHLLYQRSNLAHSPLGSIGEFVLRSAAAIEQTFGGINANLWDDPFEWTLPEQLSTAELIVAHLADVEQTRLESFARFTNDDSMKKTASTPGGLMTLAELLLQTLVRATEYQAQAEFAFKAAVTDFEL